MKTTRMLLLVSTVFVLLNFPSHMFRVYFFFIGLSNQQYNISSNTQYWQELMQMVYYSNFAINFFLYTSSHRAFRSVLTTYLKCEKCTKKYFPVTSNRRQDVKYGSRSSSSNKSLKTSNSTMDHHLTSLKTPNKEKYIAMATLHYN